MKTKFQKKKKKSRDIWNTSITHNLTDPSGKILQDISPDFLMFNAYVRIEVKQYERKLVENKVEFPFQTNTISVLQRYPIPQNNILPFQIEYLRR